MEGKGVPDVLMIGTGEYTTGYVHNSQSASDKKIGVVALTFFDLQTSHRGSKIGKAKMVGTNGTKFVGIREHFKKNITSVYKDITTEFESFPADDVKSDPEAWRAALKTMKKGDIVSIFTPDDTHFIIAKEAILQGLHVIVTKPPVKTLKEHRELVDLAKKHGVLAYVEYHKRFDPMYADARERIRNLGEFNYFNSYMSQPKFQLDTFKAWAGISSDISYYLNSHHIDFHCWSMQGIAVPTRVIAMSSNGVAISQPYNCHESTEDTITLLVQWTHPNSGHNAIATYTASWVASKADVHSQQKFHYLGAKGEVNIDQAHRGYQFTSDSGGFASLNPIYMKYTPDSKGRFSGQNGYGYKSIENFVDGVIKVRNGESPDEFNDLPTLASTATTTAILEAGRISLDNKGRPVLIRCETSEGLFHPVELTLE